MPFTPSTTTALSAAQAAGEVMAVQFEYAQRGRGLAHAALAGARECVEWAHYPDADCRDPDSGARFYYHAHPAAERAPGEHGHFHVFVAMAGEPAFSHLIAISIDANGMPTRLFTTNRWVTGEQWLPADALSARIDSFRLRTRGRLAPLARWLQAMVHLYRDAIAELLAERDRVLADAQQDLAEALEDQGLHIVSQRAVSLLARLDESLAAA